jgi:hypothetical protein
MTVLAAIPTGPLAVIVILVGLVLVLATAWAVSRPTRVLYCRACGWLKGTGHALGCDGRYGYWVPPHRVR